MSNALPFFLRSAPVALAASGVCLICLGEAFARKAVAEVPAIVTIRRKGRAAVPDMTPEEHQRRGDAADALWCELVRRATGKAS